MLSFEEALEVEKEQRWMICTCFHSIYEHEIVHWSARRGACTKCKECKRFDSSEVIDEQIRH